MKSNIPNWYSAVLPNNTALFVIGDIHGYADHLRTLLAAIYEAINNLPKNTAVKIVFLGDYGDRGPNTFDVIETLITEQEIIKTINNNNTDYIIEFITLYGNHDKYMKQALFNELNDMEIRLWLRRGGYETVTSYLDLKRYDFLGGNLNRTLNKWRQSVPKSHYVFLENLVYYFECGDYLCAHAGIDAKKPLAQQTEFDFLYNTANFLKTGQFVEARFFVHGHWPSDKQNCSSKIPDISRVQRMGIDTDIANNDQKGALTCVCIYNGKTHFISVPRGAPHKVHHFKLDRRNFAIPAATVFAL